MALQSLMQAELATAGESSTVREPHFAPRAKRMIWLFMHGGPSHVDLFDPKPELTRYAGQPLPESFGEVMRYTRPSAAPTYSRPFSIAGGK